MGPAALAQVLRPIAALFPASDYGDLLVGLGTADDAAVYRVAEDMALVVTADFFPPVVDDPYDYGAVAAANAMSDVFAMSGEVMLALNLAAFPAELAPEVITAIVGGGAEAVRHRMGAAAGRAGARAGRERARERGLKQTACALECGGVDVGYVVTDRRDARLVHADSAQAGVQSGRQTHNQTS